MPADLRICFLGDSLTLGVGDAEARGWVGRVAAATRARGIDLTAYNLGVRGETTGEIEARFEHEVEPRLLPGADCRVVLCAGVADTVVLEGRLLSTESASVAALHALLSAAAARGLAALVVGPPPVADPDHDARIASLSSRFQSECADRGIPFIAVHGTLSRGGAWLGEVASGDGYHPGAAGYAELAAVVLGGGWWEWLGAPSAF